jgi:predicted thioredoxin/glutaredoxin
MLVGMKDRRQIELQIFVEAECEPCERAQELGRELDDAFPQLRVRVSDIHDRSARRNDVFAVPTFVLDGQVFSLGNPEPEALRRGVERLLNGRHKV